MFSLLGWFQIGRRGSPIKVWAHISHRLYHSMVGTSQYLPSLSQRTRTRNDGKRIIAVIVSRSCSTIGKWIKFVWPTRIRRSTKRRLNGRYRTIHVHYELNIWVITNQFISLLCVVFFLLKTKTSDIFLSVACFCSDCYSCWEASDICKESVRFRNPISFCLDFQWVHQHLWTWVVNAVQASFFLDFKKWKVFRNSRQKWDNVEFLRMSRW